MQTQIVRLARLKMLYQFDSTGNAVMHADMVCNKFAAHSSDAVKAAEALAGADGNYPGINRDDIANAWRHAYKTDTDNLKRELAAAKQTIALLQPERCSIS